VLSRPYLAGAAGTRVPGRILTRRMPRLARPRPAGVPPAEAFSLRLRRIREARGFSQRELAKAIGISQRMVAYYETRAERPPGHHLTAMAQVLRVSIDQLMGYRPFAAPAGTAVLGNGHRPNPRLWATFREAERLPPEDRRQVVQLIRTLVERQALKQRSASKSR
jgi:transcriptional regulator with XRE-family HTH domain